jgi:hypothetical protein
MQNDRGVPFKHQTSRVVRDWQVVHRHADPVSSDTAAELIEQLVASDS